MFDIGWSEMAVIVLVALIVIGPKDLPKVARTIGQWTGKARALARDFQRSLDDMAREAELDEIKNTIQKTRPSNIRKAITESIDPEGELERAFDVETPSPSGKGRKSVPAVKPQAKAVPAVKPQAKAVPAVKPQAEKVPAEPVAHDEPAAKP